MHKTKSLLLICSLFSLLIPGCSKDKLDRETTKAAIDKKLRGMNVGLTVTTGRVGSHCYTMQAGSETIDMDDNPERGPIHGRPSRPVIFHPHLTVKTFGRLS